jgi:hypothetical protein
LEREREREYGREQQRRWLARVFLAGASAVVLAALVLKLVGGLPSIRLSWPELARKTAVRHFVIE